MASLGFSEPEKSSFSVSKYFHMVFGPTFWTCLGQALDISWVLAQLQLDCYRSQISQCGMGQVTVLHILAHDLQDNGDGDTFAHTPSWEFLVPFSKAFQGPNHGEHSRE